ncbi:MAG: hypothetical protein ACI952_001910, partial [Flavobacteriales bacterium]
MTVARVFFHVEDDGCNSFSFTSRMMVVIVF